MSTTLEKQVLVRAHGLIKDREHWTRGVEARAGNGREVSYSSAKAKRFCAIGAIRRAAWEITGDETVAARVFAGIETWMLEEVLTGEREIWMFNDTRSHAEVVQLFEKALATV